MSHVNRLAPLASQRIDIKKRVVMLVYDGIGPFQLSGPMMVFGQNGQNTSFIDFMVCAIRSGSFRTAAGFNFNALYGLEALDQADAVIVPGWRAIDEPVPVELKNALCRANARGVHLAGLCLGVFVLAEAGLLDSRRATTHWQRADVFEKRYPLVWVDRDIQYVRDKNIWSSGGGVPAIDTCLQLLQELQGIEVANQVARYLVGTLPRQKDQALSIEKAGAYRDGNARLQQLLSWMLDHPDEPQGLEVLADRVHMTVRTFTRRFKQLTGATVIEWRVSQRLKRVQSLLEISEATVESIAQQTGFVSPLSLRQHFKKAFGLTPMAYRKKLKRSR